MAINKGNPHIYILKDAGNNALKIGYTLDLQQRLRGHSTSNPFLKLIVAFPVSGQHLETTLHKILHDFRILNTREWYQDCPGLRKQEANRPMPTSEVHSHDSDDF